MLKAGISTACLYPQPIEEALYDLALGGVTMVELFINTHSELKRSFVAALSDMKCSAVPSIHSPVRLKL